MKKRLKIMVLAVKLLIVWIGLRLFKESKWPIREWVFKAWYENLAQIIGLLFIDFYFMNYGYSDTDKRALNLPKETLQANLYQKLIAMSGLSSWSQLSIAEVGSGRGGGIHYIFQTYNPVEAIGIDLAYKAIEFCNKTFKVAGLTYIQGNAQELPLAAQSVDVVLNVESSHCYPHFDLFCKEVCRVLKPKGLLLYADFMTPQTHEEKKKAFLDAGFNIKKHDIITHQVIQSLHLDHDRKKLIINSALVPFFIRKGLSNFSGCIGSICYKKFVSGEWMYVAYILEKS